VQSQYQLQKIISATDANIETQQFKDGAQYDVLGAELSFTMADDRVIAALKSGIPQAQWETVPSLHR